MLTAADLATWLAEFWFLGGSIFVTCNGMGILAWDAEGKHYFSIVGYSEDEVAQLFDVITPYL